MLRRKIQFGIPITTISGGTKAIKSEISYPKTDMLPKVQITPIITTIIETNIDDMAGEFLGYVHERLFELGARDVWFTPIQMKKNRPAFMMSAIIPSDLKTQAIRLIVRETSTLGVRVRPLERYEAQRENAQIDTSLGTIKVKIKRLDGEILGVSPEYESCRRLALKCELPLQKIYRIVQREVEDHLLEN